MLGCWVAGCVVGLGVGFFSFQFPVFCFFVFQFSVFFFFFFLFFSFFLPKKFSF